MFCRRFVQEQKLTILGLRRPMMSTSSCAMSTLVIGQCHPETHALLPSTLSALTAAAQCEKQNTSNISLFIPSASFSPSSFPCPLHACYTPDDALPDKLLLPENIAHFIVQLQTQHKFKHIVCPPPLKSSLFRAAAVLDIEPLSDVMSMEDGGGASLTRPMYAGNALATLNATQQNVLMMSIRPTSFAEMPTESHASEGKMSTISLDHAPFTSSTLVSRDAAKSGDRPELGSARVVISGGRGLKDGSNFQLLEALADACGEGAVGASRAAVDAGMVPNDMQIGQTGKVVAPELYMAVGISGAIQHVAGMKESGTIVAINKDEEAPIFQVADYGLVADLFTAVPELTSQINQIKK